MAVVFLNVVCFALSTVEDGDEWLVDVSPDTVSALRSVFLWVERVSVGIFTLEYLARLATITVCDEFRGWEALELRGSGWGVLRFALTPFALLDLVSVLPFFVDLVLSGDQIPAVQFVRLLRIFRVLASGEYAEAFRAMGLALYKNKGVRARGCLCESCCLIARSRAVSNSVFACRVAWNQWPEFAKDWP